MLKKKKEGKRKRVEIKENHSPHFGGSRDEANSQGDCVLVVLMGSKNRDLVTFACVFSGSRFGMKSEVGGCLGTSTAAGVKNKYFLAYICSLSDHRLSSV